ncbi:gelsolin-related protein of 125 kDa isoform X3 [Eurytemora carolleeae]|uniref:gelsolin-related protein of 125 kDa isoform X3 n=1 Tax=Eurytemora carolleeae TaxID=1294199 RepID=UPI000C75E49A|nr:gelsolin-related protein of 125 kDa isoform X3 [Eurytemora carolleeae]|eukprot:XP_023332358.1 gelsolin-related protein of 125 kDa-like isoform X3 [Eurytemora affinis]
MAENQRKKIKMENIDIIDAILLPSTLEETCAVYIKEEDVKVEISEPYQEDTCTVYVKEEEIKEEEIKEENICIKDEVPSPSTEEDTCTVYVKEEDVKMENTEITDEIVLNEEDPLLVGSKITKKRKLEGVIYSCDKCDYTATCRGTLSVIMQRWQEDRWKVNMME